MATLKDLLTKKCSEMTDEELEQRYHSLSRMRVVTPTMVKSNKQKRTKNAQASLPSKVDDLSIEQLTALLEAKKKGNL